MSLAAVVRFSLTQRLLLLLVIALLIPAGWWAFRSIPIDAFPDISPTQVKIIMKAPGMTPEEVESRITRLIEVELLGVQRQTMLRSVAKYALTDITVDFEEGTDIYWARQQVAERLTAVQDSLPEGVSGGLAPMSTPLGEMYMFTVDSPELSLSERRYLLDWVIRPALRTVPGVADVNALGGLVKTYSVAPRPDAMLALGITTGDIADALQRNNQNDGAGRLGRGEETLLVRSEGALDSIGSIEATPVLERDGKLVTVGMVATVSLGSLERYGAVSENGVGEVVEGLVVSLRGANARDVISGIEEKLEDVRQSLPEHVTISVFYNRSHLVNRAISTVSRALVEAVVLVLILLGLFLGNFRSALTVALILPLSALVTFIAMKQTGLSANLMSLGGLAIAIGLLVDAAVVVVENIVTKLSEHDGKSLPRLHIIYRAVKDVAVPVTSGILIIILVFLPLLSLQGLEGKLFRPVALTIVYALAGSLVLSLTVIPVLASFLITSGAHAEPALPRKLAALYRPMLDRALKNEWLVLAPAAILLLLSLAAFPFIGKTFMPTMDEGDIIVQLEKLPSINLETSIRLDLAVEAALLEQVPEIERIVARTGSDELGMDPMGLNETDMFMVLKPEDEWRMGSKEELEDEIRLVLDRFKGINYGFTMPIDMRVSEMLTGSRGDLAVKVFGHDLDALNGLAGQVAEVLEGIEGSTDVLTTVNEGMQYIVLRPNRDLIGRYGIDLEQILDHVKVLVEGLPAGTVIEGSARVPIVLRSTQVDGDPLARFAGELVNLPGGGYVPLSTLMAIERVEGPVAVKREKGRRFVVVMSNVKGRDLVGFVEEAQDSIRQAVELPPGFHIEWGGEFENQQRAAQRLMMVVPVALVLIFLLLFSTFRSVLQAGLVLANIPLALIGGVLALAVSGHYMSVPASVGFIALMGIAVLNGVVMVSYFNQLGGRGLSLDEVVRLGSERRLRPVMMTASIAALGLVPLLFVSGPGSEIQKPLAVVVIGGLVTSTALTLFILPVLYRRFSRSE
ncbi:MAG: CusA/CzcA family heavy metal efflux RND transporter [Xanthomonadales bacterium]|jgi:cobalt-zinc-cadmium resistance protein CzcA|nr:CusA/CzcA family heavy metal efflux RND transporter [Xanthomonadales bacterium]